MTSSWLQLQCIPTPRVWVDYSEIGGDDGARLLEDGSERLMEDGTERVLE